MNKILVGNACVLDCLAFRKAGSGFFYEVGRVLFAFDKTISVDDLVVHMLSAAIHSLGRTGGCDIHQVMP